MCLSRNSGEGSQLLLERLAQLFRGLGDLLGGLPRHLRPDHAVLHARVGAAHRVAAAELGPGDPHALHLAQPGLHDCASCLSTSSLCSRTLALTSFTRRAGSGKKRKLTFLITLRHQFLLRLFLALSPAPSFFRGTLLPYSPFFARIKCTAGEGARGFVERDRSDLII